MGREFFCAFWRERNKNCGGEILRWNISHIGYWCKQKFGIWLRNDDTLYTLRKRLKRGFCTAGRGGKRQVHKGEMEHSSGNNIIGYSGNHMGVFQERQPSAKSEKQDVPGVSDCYLCGHAEQYTVHLYAERLYPCACLGYMGNHHHILYTDASYGDGVLSLCGFRYIWRKAPA